MDQELITYLDARFRETAEQIQGLREETAEQIQGLRQETTGQIQGLRQEMQEGFAKVNDEVHQARIQIEDLRHSIGLVAEASLGQRETLHSFRQEILSELQEVRTAVALPYQNLDRRLQVVERKVSGRDPVEVIREMLADGTFYK